MDKATAKKVADEIREAIELIANRHGMTSKVGTGRFGAHDLRTTITVRDACAPNPEAEAFKLHAEAYGLSPADLGRKAYSGGQTFTVIGLSMKARRKPIVLRRDSDGTTYRCSEWAAKSMLAAAADRAAGA